MEQTSVPASKTKVALVWALCVGTIVFWIVFWLWRVRNRPPEPAPGGSDVARAIVMLFVGGFFLIMGMAGYALAVFTQCLTFNFNRPVWSGLKGKIFLTNIFVPLGVALGFGFMLSAVLTPVLESFGIRGGIAYMLPVFIPLAGVQIAQLWIGVWTPVMKRVIAKRLAAQNITAAQLRTGILIGISNPEISSLKKFGAIEDDIGALWLWPDQLFFCGDTARFSITRPQLARVERRADSASTTMLSGIAHVILHVALPDGTVRQMRLHTEGLWTMGQKRQAMENLAQAIIAWHAAPGPPPIPTAA